MRVIHAFVCLCLFSAVTTLTIASELTNARDIMDKVDAQQRKASDCDLK